jgi:esterase
MEITKFQAMPDGAALYYRLWQAGRKPRGLVVLLHGMASNLTRWSEFVEHTTLRHDWDLLRPDLRGHGHSLMRGRIGASIWVDDLIELLDAEHREQAVIIGHSLGAHVALHFAHRFPERVRALVLIDPAFPKALRGYWRLLRLFRPLFSLAAATVRLVNALGLRRRQFPHRDLRLWDEAIRTELLGAGRSSEFVKRYSSPRTDLRYFPFAHYLQELAEMTRPLPKLSCLPIATLVLLSRGATFADPARTQTLLAKLPHVETCVIDAHHWPLTEKPEEIRRAIEDWISRRVC